MKITTELITKIDDLLSYGLPKGLGSPEKGKMCVEALICNAMGEPHSDKPSCVGSEVNSVKIALNDCNWSSNEARAKGMSKIAKAQLGSIALDQTQFKKILFYNSSKTVLVFLIEKHFNKEKDDNLLEWIEKFKNCTIDTVDTLWGDFYYNYYYYNYNYYYYYYYNYNNNYNKYCNYFGDKFLIMCAEVILQTLKDMNCEGCKWI